MAKCEKSGADKITFESYIQNESAGKYWLDFSEGWYLENGYGALNLREGYKYPTVVCGELYDLNTENTSGHCMVAFTQNKILNSEDIKELSGAPIVEPQNGMYVGLVDDLSSGISLRPSTIYSSSIFLIITDSDILLFDDNASSWDSYSGFNESLTELKLRAINASPNG